MKTKIVFMVMLLVSAVSWAGQEGHATGTIRCADGAQVFDLYEGRKQGLNIVESNVAVDTQIDNAFKKLGTINPAFEVEARKMLKLAQQVQKSVPVGEALIPPTDSGLKTLPKGCQFEAAAKWFDSYDFRGDPVYTQDELLIDDTLLSELSSRSATQVAALWVHEAIYKTYRDRSYSGDSQFARKVTAYLFSDSNNIPSVTSTIPRGVPVLKISGTDLDDLNSVEAYVFPVGDKIRIQIVRAGLFAFGPMAIEMKYWYTGGPVKAHAQLLGEYLADPTTYRFIDYVSGGPGFSDSLTTFFPDAAGVSFDTWPGSSGGFRFGWMSPKYEASFDLTIKVMGRYASAGGVSIFNPKPKVYSIVTF